MTHNQNIVVISQARMTSTRLPGKVLKEIAGKSLLKYHIDRLQSAHWKIVIATTVNETDDPIIHWANENSIQTFRGSETNVLERYYQTAKHYKADIIIRVTSDCPLIDGALIERGIEQFMAKQDAHLYVSNCFPRTYARGFDFEIFAYEALSEAYANAIDVFDQEHVTPYLWKNKSGQTTILNLAQQEDCSDLRLCVDTPEDFDLIQILLEKYKSESMSHRQIENLLRQHPELVGINAHVEQKKH